MKVQLWLAKGKPEGIGKIINFIIIIITIVAATKASTAINCQSAKIGIEAYLRVCRAPLQKFRGTLGVAPQRK